MMFGSLDQFAAYLRRDLDDEDAYTAEMLLTAASDLIIDYCGWCIAPRTTETFTIDGSGVITLALPTLHLVDVASVVENDRALDVSAVYWSELGILTKARGGPWTTRPRGVVATVTHGYADAPSWVAHIVYALAGRVLNTVPGVQQEMSGGEMVYYTTASTVLPGVVMLTDAERNMLDRIRVPLRP